MSLLTQLTPPHHPNRHVTSFPRVHRSAALQICELRVFRRRRLKHRRLLTLRCSFHDGIVSGNAFQFLAPVVGALSGAALLLSNFSDFAKKRTEIGQWLLLTSPTPFNRSVVVRCPSISPELLNEVEEKLVVKEDGEFMTVNSGRILSTTESKSDTSSSNVDEKLEYQRICVKTEDGGVVALDWPASLDLEEERGLDTTLILVPGTAQGSTDKNVRSFVCQALSQGCFPIVVNPRGCASSPLTTPRLFSAADSDDVSTAVQFINKARSGTTLVAIGWGFGANMLTKYLAEIGECSPLTAAVCIDNPFDLVEVTKSSPSRTVRDQELTDGLIDILRSNKGLFQGKAKGFDVEGALSANSLREFEKAISMVSHGFGTIEEFYANSSTNGVVGDVKIPVLFIQKDDDLATPYSIPRSSIAEKPFTSLLLCSCLPSRGIDDRRSVLSWCQHLSIEWLMAVELGLLKGRHPLLKDVDIPFEPSRELAYEGIDTAASFWLKSKNGSSDGYTMSQPSSVNGYTANYTEKMSEESNTATSFLLASKKESWRESDAEPTDLQGVKNGAVNQTHSDEPELLEQVDPEEGERGQALQTAQVVMNMLDVTMPNVLSEEKKKKVLAAVDKGDTLMQALQDAVPEDVRGKLTEAVSGVLHAQGPNLKFDQLLRIGRIPDIGSKPKIQDTGASSLEVAHEDHRASDLSKKSDDLLDSSVDSQPAADKPSKGLESESLPAEQSQKIPPVDRSSSTGESDISGSVTEDTTKSGSSDAEQISNSEKGPERTKPNNSTQSTGITVSAEGSIVVEERHQDGTATQIDTKDEDGNDNQKKDTKNTQPVIDQNMSNTSDPNAPAPTASAPTAPVPNVPAPNAPAPEAPAPNTPAPNAPAPNVPAPNVPAPSAPAFSVSEAFDALTGMDDSTQMAVNNVFGVLENMITQLEESSEHENEEKESDSTPVKDQDSGNNDEEDLKASKLDKSEHSDEVSDVPVSESHVNSTVQQHPDVSNVLEVMHAQSPKSVDGNSISSSQGSDRADQLGEDKVKKREQLAGIKTINHVNNVPPYLASVPPYITSISSGVHNYLLSKVRAQSLDLDSTAALLLDYFPEEGQWKLLEQPGHSGWPVGDEVAHKGEAHKPVDDEVIEPSYVILDTEKHQEPIQEYKVVENVEEGVEISEDEREDFGEFVRNVILDSLTVEVGRRQSADDIIKMEPYLTKDLEQVATAVSVSVGHAFDPHLEVEYHSVGSEKVGTLHGEHVIKAISSAVQETSFLRRVVPVGVIVGSSLAALRKHFIVATVRDSGQIEPPMFSRARVSGENLAKVRGTEKSFMPDVKTDHNTRLDDSVGRKEENTESMSLNNSVMVGAVTAAIGASALLAEHQESITSDETFESSFQSIKTNGNDQMEPENHEDSSEKHQSNIVTSLAEKAMSVAAPVIPKRQDGGLDQERLLAMLVDMGQRGGMLRLVGKLALLWGGMRGAMSLTDKLIQFLRLSERPLYQRILGFAGMTLVLWSPVVVPLLPTFMQSWTTHTPSKIADLAGIFGLYAAFMILLTLWGKRIRGYEDPIVEYGIDLMSLPKLFDFLKGLIGGVVLVLSIQSTNALLGCVNICWPSAPSSFDAMKLLSVYGHVFALIGQSILTATGIATVEELFFRAWLPQEIAADLGYHRSIVLSGLVFALCQRSLWAIPGLWLLSVSLAGARQRNQGSLSVPIGLRAGILATNFILQRGGFLTYQPESPLWIIGTHQFQPLSGLTGFAFALLLVIVLHPTVPLPSKTLESTTEE